VSQNVTHVPIKEGELTKQLDELEDEIKRVFSEVKEKTKMLGAEAELWSGYPPKEK